MDRACLSLEFAQICAQGSGCPGSWLRRKSASGREEENQWHPCVIPSAILAAVGQAVSVAEREICFCEECSACVGVLFYRLLLPQL